MSNKKHPGSRAQPDDQTGVQPPSDDQPPADDQPDAKAKTARVKFLIPWSGALGYFAFGRVAEFPASIADSLIKENVAEPSSAEISEK